MLPLAHKLIAARFASNHARRAARLAVIGCLASGLAVTVTQVMSGQDLPRAVPGVPVVIPVTDERLLDPEPESWLMYRRTYDGLGFSPLRQIDANNVVDLSPAWTFPTDTDDGVPQAPPIVNGGMMFVTTAEQVIALDAETGSLLWRHVHPLPADVQRPHAANRGVALYDDQVYVGTLDAHVVALEAATGQVVWDRAIADYRRTYYITMAPLVVNGMVMVGYLRRRARHPGVRHGARCRERRRGLEAVYDPGTRRAGQRDVVRRLVADRWGSGLDHPDVRSRARHRLLGNRQRRPLDRGHASGRQPLHELDHCGRRRHRRAARPLSVSLERILGLGRSQRPLLVDIERDGRTIPALVHPGRNGYLWLLDRSGGGMRFLEAQPFVRQNVFASLDPFTGRPEYDPERRPGIGKRVTFCPSFVGARDWRPEAFSPRTGLLYIPAINNLCSTMEGRRVEYRAGRSFVGATVDVFQQDGTDHVGELQAWSLRTGQRVWTRELPTRMRSVLATAGNLVLADSGGSLHAFDALSGEQLWRYATEGHRPVGVPMSYAVGGVQYIALLFEALRGAPAGGDMVVAFRIDCQC